MRWLTAAVAAVWLFVVCGAEPIHYDGPEWPKVTPAFQVEAERIHASTSVRRTDAPDFSHPPDVRVRKEGGTPRLFLDGKPFPLFCGRLNTGVRKDRLPRLADIPFNVVTVDNIYWPVVFPNTGTVNTNLLMKRGALFATNCPNAYFIWTVEATVPKDWAKAHPDEICRDSAGETTHNGVMPNWSCGSRLALNIAKEQVRKVIDAIEASPFANRTIGYLITSGHTTEWLGWEANEREGRTIDFSPAALKSFREFATKRYGAVMEDAAMPDFESRHAFPGRLLWNPREHLAAVACHEWLSEQMAANLVEVCGDAKRHLGGKKLVGSYYGYTMTLFVDGNSQARAHYALERVLESGVVDFLLSPQDYVMRMLGEPCIDMKPFASIAAHGVVPIIENDARTHCGRMLGVYPKGHCQTFTAEQSRGILRRDMGTALCRNQPLCLYDLMLGTGFDFPECVEDGRAFAAVHRWCTERKVRRRAEIAVVMGESSITASPRNKATFVPGGVEVPMYAADGTAAKIIRKRCLYAGEIASLGLSRMARIGAPVDYLLAEDLAANPGDYKMYVFLNCTRYDDRLLAAVRGLQAKNCTILWTYAPGYVKGIDASVSNMQELSGFEFTEKKGLCEPVAVFKDGREMGTPDAKAAPLFEVRNADETLARYRDGSIAIAAKRVGNSLSVCSCVWLYDTAFLRQMAERSGVHSFVSTDDPVEANGSFFMLHARREGRKTVRLPRKASVVDVFAQRIVARNAESFDFDAPLHSSHLFYYGDEPESFLPRSCVKVSEFGYDLEDSTRFLQAALDSGAKKVVLDRQAGPWVTLPLKMRSNTELVFEPGVELLAKRGAYKGLRDYLLELPHCTNVTIRGGAGSKLRMWKKDYQGPDYSHGEWRYALRIFHCENVLVEGLTIMESGGDGIGITGKNITIRNCVCDRNHRQGMSVFSVENLLIENCVMRGTSGTAPQSGIDFEPDHPHEKLKNVIMRNCLSESNMGEGFQFYLGQLNDKSEDVSITLENCRSVGNVNGTWFDLGVGRSQPRPPKGFIRYVNCTFERSRECGISVLDKPAGSMHASFENCAIVDAATNGTSAAMRIGTAIKPDQPVTDDMRFDNLTIRIDDGREWLSCERSLLTTQKVENVTGTARIVRSGGAEEMVVFDAAWAEKWMKPKAVRPLPPRMEVTEATWNRARVADCSPGAEVSLSRIWFPYGANYVFYAPQSGRIGISGRTRPSQARNANLYGPNQLKGAVKVRSVKGGKTLACDAPGADGGAIAVDVPAAGFYTLSAKVAGGDFALESSSVPVAVDTREKYATMLFDGETTASFWFEAPKSGTVVMVRGGTYSGSCANLSLVDAEGCVAARTVAGGEWGVLYAPEGNTPGLWRLDFSRIEGRPYTFFALDMAARPGLFFLSSDKTWMLEPERPAPVPSAMRPLPQGALRLHGVVDDAIRKSVENWTLGKVPYREFAEFFRKGRPQFALGEMWGKFVRAAALQYRYTGDERIRAVVEDAVRDVLTTERKNGSISCDPIEAQPGDRGGDLWERKYVMLGLERYLENIRDGKSAMASLVRQADCIISQIGESPKSDIRSLGWSANHIESSTLLEPIVNLYAMTGESRFLGFARYVVDCGGAFGYNLVQQACDNMPPHEMGGVYPKAYEMLSFFEGLIEYYRFTGDETVRRACLNLFSNILTNELTIVGNGGGDQPYHPKVMGEAWDRTAFEQTNPAMKRMMETCVGVTWLKFCGRILSLTGDVRAADVMERYVYNGLLGAMTPNGDGFSYVTLLNGRKTTNEGWGWDFPSCRVTCCNLNGPIGLAYVPYYAVMQGDSGPVVNLYEAFNATVRVGMEDVRLFAPSGLTDGDVWKLDVAPEREMRFTMRLRIPGWSERTRVCVCGEDVADVKAGRYLDIDRLWQKGDRVEISFDWRARKVSAPKGCNRTGDNFAAVTWGPIVLSRDENTDPQFGADVDVVADRDGFVAVEKVALPEARHRLEFEVPTSDGPIRMCDYASADSWNGKRVMTWLPTKGVKVSSFGYDASDSTRFLQAALDSGEKKIVIDRMDGPWVTEPLFARSNLEIVFEPGVELVAKKGSFHGKRDCLVVLDGVTNVTIRGGNGATLRMRRDDYAAPPYVRSEWRHALAIRNSRNVKIVGMTFAESGGDGVVVSGGSENVELLDCVMTRNFRQGVSVISCKGFLAEGCLFEKTQGTNPESGIDFEPDRPEDRLVSCMVRNCRSIENAGSAFHVAPVMLDSSSDPIGVRFENCVSENDGMGVEIALYRSGNYPTGRVVFAGCEFRSPRRGCLFVNKPFGTMDVAFANCQFLDAKDADFLFQTEQWDFDPPDGIRFSNVFCRQLVDRPVFSFPVPGFGRKVDSLSGRIKLESPSGVRTINLSPEWCAANIPRASGGEPKPRMEADVTSLWPLENVGCEMRQIGPVALAHRQRLILRVDTPRKVRLLVRQIPGRSKIYSPIPLKIRRVGGDFRREIPMPKEGPAEVSFDAVTPGHYAMELDAYHSRFVIDAANVPIAVDATSRYREFCLPPGVEAFEFSFVAKKGVPFSFLTRVIYPDDDYSCELFDSSGRKIAGRQLPHGWNVMEGEADGLVRAVFTRQGGSSLHAGNVFVDLTGAPGLLFLAAVQQGGEAFERTKFRIGCFSFNPPAQTPQHVAEAKACGLDYVGGGIDLGKCPVMDDFSRYGLNVNGHFLPRVVGGTPARGTAALREKFPRETLAKMLDEFNAKHRHSAIEMMNICDEPPAQSMEFIGDVVRLMKEKCPDVLAYVNLYPSYAFTSKNGQDAIKKQLGCATYKEYIEEYCRSVPTHFIAYDHYPIGPTPERTRRAMPRWYGNLKVVADACRETGRDLWVGPQVNTVHGTEPISENSLRYQAFSSMAFGAVTLTWACWTYGWGTNQVMEADGTLTCQYPKLKKVNAEIHRIAEEYMKYRNAATHFVGFSGEREALSKYGIKPVERLDASGVTGLAAEDGSALVIGEMTPRAGRGPANALFIYAADDCADERRAEHVVSFASERRPVVFGPDGRREIEAAGSGRWRLTLADNSCALIVMKEKMRTLCGTILAAVNVSGTDIALASHELRISADAIPHA